MCDRRFRFDDRVCFYQSRSFPAHSLRYLFDTLPHPGLKVNAPAGEGSVHLIK